MRAGLDASGGQVGDSQYSVGNAWVEPAELRSNLQSAFSGASSANCVTLDGAKQSLTMQAGEPPGQVVHRFDLREYLVELSVGLREFPAVRVRPSEPNSTGARSEVVPNGVGD
jgi:hypothetical protein